MDFKYSEDGGAVVVHCQGSGNYDSAWQFKAAVKAYLAEGNTQIVVDLGEVDALDSSFLGALAKALNMTRKAGGDLLIAGASSYLWSMFELIRFDSLFGRYESVEKAGQYFSDNTENEISPETETIAE